MVHVHTHTLVKSLYIQSTFEGVKLMHNRLDLSLLQRCGYSMEPSPNTNIEATFTPDGQYVLSGIRHLHWLIYYRSYHIYMFSNVILFFLFKVLEMEICMPGASTGGMRYDFLGTVIKMSLFSMYLLIFSDFVHECG